MSRCSVLLCCLFLVPLFCAGSALAFEEPGGSYTSEYGGQLQLEYQGEGMVSVKLKTEMCTFVDDSGASGTFANHGITARNDQGEVVMIIMYDKDYAVVYADYPEMGAYCTEYNDATDYYAAQ